MGLSANDNKILLELIDIIYGASSPDILISQLFDKLGKALGISSAVFMPGGGDIPFKHKGSVVLRCDPKEVRAYVSYYLPLDPFIRTGWFKQPNRAARNTDLMPAKFLTNSEFAVDFLSEVPCLWIIGATVGTADHIIGIVGLHRLRRDPNFSDRDIALTNAVLPHVSRALLMLEQLNQRPRATGIVILDDKGTVIYTNDAANRILGQKPASVIPLPIGRSPLHQNRTVYHTERGNYEVSLTNTPSQYKVIALEPAANSDARSRLAFLGLTARQQEIALGVLRGLSNRAIADELHITEQTVKDHLNAIFKKLGINRRSQLAATVFTFTGSRVGDLYQKQ